MECGHEAVATKEPPVACRLSLESTLLCPFKFPSPLISIYHHTNDFNLTLHAVTLDDCYKVEKQKEGWQEIALLNCRKGVKFQHKKRANFL